MPKPTETQPEVLKGWKQIAEFLGHPAAVVQRWASEGMPVSKQGRFVTTTPEQLNAWLGKQSGKPVHVATPDTDLAAELKRHIAVSLIDLKSPGRKFGHPPGRKPKLLGKRFASTLSICCNIPGLIPVVPALDNLAL